MGLYLNAKSCPATRALLGMRAQTARTWSLQGLVGWCGLVRPDETCSRLGATQHTRPRRSVGSVPLTRHWLDLSDRSNSRARVAMSNGFSRKCSRPEAISFRATSSSV